jgi:anti-sigma factor RsiW
MNRDPRDQRLFRLHDGELSPTAAAELRSELTAEDHAKLQALADVDAVLSVALTAEADEAGLDLWSAIEAKLPVAAPPSGKLLPFLRRRTVQVTALLSTLAAAAGLIFLLTPAGQPPSNCQVEELEVIGHNATVLSIPAGRGHETALIWFDHQETDEWESL